MKISPKNIQTQTISDKPGSNVHTHAHMLMELDKVFPVRLPDVPVVHPHVILRPGVAALSCHLLVVVQVLL